MKDKLPAETLQRVTLGHALAEWSGDNIPVINAIAKQSSLMSLRDVALRYRAKKLYDLIDDEAVPKTTVGTTPEEKKKNFATVLHNKLFATETSAVLQRLRE